MRTQLEIDTQFADRAELDHVRSFFLVGIGGASMSALALMLKSHGTSVSGSDSTASPVTAELMSEGIPIRIGHDGEGIKPGDAVILTDAIDLTTNPEVRRARELGCKLFRRSQLLGWLLKGKRVLAVTGTHGKTTTTGLASFALIESGFDPLCIEGANLPQWGGPVRYGEGKWAVIEACEAYNSLTDLDPEIVVLTNLELDHEDFYSGGWGQLKQTMLDFVNRAKVLVYCREDDGASQIAAAATCQTVGYEREEIELSVLGSTNELNASGALLAATIAGAERDRALAGLKAFQGAERRLQLIWSGDIEVIDDYAHHPSEIVASIDALRRQYPERRLVVAFQPHLYSRTAAHLPEFASALSLADVLLLTDIYPAREEPIPGVSSARIAEKATSPCSYVPSRFLLPRSVAKAVKPGDVVVGMGAGTIGEFAVEFVGEWKRLKSASRRVVVVYGGDSAEREVSLLSGRCIHAALKAKGYEVELVDLTELMLTEGTVKRFVGVDRPDLAFLAVHGTHAEDGAIQGFFELLDIPYTGSGILASALAMDKDRTKQALGAVGLPVPRGYKVVETGLGAKLPLPLVVKPNSQGSTVGLSFVRQTEEYEPAIARALQYDHIALVEELIEGMEISVPVLGDRALPPVEIVPKSGTYDFDSKYTPGATEEICPARLPAEVADQAKEFAVAAHKSLGCTGATRTDMIVRDGQCIILEVNTLPGMTGTSLLPNSAQADGIPFEDLCDWIAQDALTRHRSPHGS